MDCCICGLDIEGHGHNPDPINRENNARCCGVCNASIVLPTRLQEALLLRPRKRKEEDE